MTENNSSESTVGVTGDHTIDGRPVGYTSLTPFIAVTDAAAAIGFYRRVFGAELVAATEMGGVVAHADLDFGVGRLQLGEVNPEYHLVAGPGGDDVCFSLALYVTDVDAVVQRAVADGAVVREPAAQFVSGDRFASIRDPYGIRWSVMTRTVDISDEESARRVDEWAASI
ncbi:glyoxalase [Gordonia spumicola]|uniref:Glyoxalase n=1 Tax=Gordonia spumicola TaxID=589161 RepID=A0A7I9VDJ3_9ACTN|nr:VOC family protein [Gordonia spumicola]GEE03374.1 glyoxalase [Gordonia spumicola]